MLQFDFRQGNYEMAIQRIKGNKSSIQKQNNTGKGLK